MTISSVTEMWSRLTSSTNSDGRTKVSKTISSAYQVVHTADSTEAEIEGANGVPQVGDLHPNYNNVYCTQSSLTTHGLVMSIVSVQYQGEVALGGDGDPLQQPPEYDYGSLSSEAEIDEDANGVPTCTTVGEPVHGITKNISDMRLRVRRNYLAFDGTLALQYMDSVNSDTYNVFGDLWQPGQAAMTSFNIKPVFNGVGTAVDYFNISATIDFRIPYRTIPARAWWARYRNEGLYVRDETKVTFSGGGGVGAAGYARINSSGNVVGVAITNPGRNYFSPPTVTFTSGSGSGAAGTAQVGATAQTDGQIIGVTITNAGSGYRRSGIHRAVDRNKEPVNKPILIAADGSALEDTAEAFWCERPVKQYLLNYTSLGLL